MTRRRPLRVHGIDSRTVVDDEIRGWLTVCGHPLTRRRRTDEASEITCPICQAMIGVAIAKAFRALTTPLPCA